VTLERRIAILDLPWESTVVTVLCALAWSAGERVLHGPWSVELPRAYERSFERDDV